MLPKGRRPPPPKGAYLREREGGREREREREISVYGPGGVGEFGGVCQSVKSTVTERERDRETERQRDRENFGKDDLCSNLDTNMHKHLHIHVYLVNMVNMYIVCIGLWGKRLCVSNRRQGLGEGH